jgi:hypothetical protein
MNDCGPKADEDLEAKAVAACLDATTDNDFV